jgi:hypothetical protein
MRLPDPGLPNQHHKRRLPVLEIAYRLLAEPTTYRELGTDYFDRCRASGSSAAASTNSDVSATKSP